MKRYTADFEVVDGSTGHRYMPGEIIVIDETDPKWKDTIPALTPLTEPSVPVREDGERADVVIPSPVADQKQDSKPRP